MLSKFLHLDLVEVSPGIPSLVVQFHREDKKFTYRNVCRSCATCCGACRSWKFPSLLSIVSLDILLRRWSRECGHTHFGSGTICNRTLVLIIADVKGERGVADVPGDAVVSIERWIDRKSWKLVQKCRFSLRELLCADRKSVV